MRMTRALLLVSLLAPATACQHSPDRGSATAAKPKRTRPSTPAGPRPLPLPARPSTLVYLAEPAPFVATAAAYAGDARPVKEVIAAALAETRATFERRLVPMVDLRRPWSAAVVEGQTIARIPIERSAVPQVEALLANARKVGSHGAVAVPRTPEEPGPKLARLDRAAAFLDLADDERGLATAPGLAKAYGRQPIALRLDAEQARAYGIEMTAQSVEATGDSPRRMRITANGVAGELPFADVLTHGALAGLVEAPTVALGVTSKYAAYQSELRQLNARIDREIAQQNFLVRGVLEDLFGRFRNAARHWDGRVMAGTGPKQHLLLGLGIDDATAANRAALHLMDGVLDNLSLARSIGLSAPALRFRRDFGEAGGIRFHSLAIPGARRYLPAELHPLVDGRGDLKLSVGFSRRAQSAIIVVGPDSSGVLTRWLDQIARATPGAETRDLFAAARIAVPPGEVIRIARDPRVALGLEPQAAATQVLVRREGDRMTFDLTPAGSRP